MSSNTYCNHIQKGMFVSHQGVSLCCVNPDKHKNIMPSEFWKGTVRADALIKMQNGEDVHGCHNCYKTEKNKMPSSRTFANSYNHISDKALPTMLDLDLSNFCNLKCVMCDASRSSEWGKDLGQAVSSISYEKLDDLADISDQLEHLTIQGGEPSIMKEYEYYFTALEKKDLPKNIDLQIITNATNVNKRFYELLKQFKKVRLSISIDAYGLANDYIRWPSNFLQIEKNLKKMSNMPNNIEIEVLNSLNTLSMFDYYSFLNWCKKIETIFEQKGKKFKVVPMKVQEPKMYSPFYAPESLKDRIVSDVKRFMKDHNLKHNTNWKTEMLLIMKQISALPVDKNVLMDLKQNINALDTQRNRKITNYIPDFYEYI
jgi:organic radical activating enzyme